MSDERRMRIYFTDGTDLQLSFEAQVAEESTIATRFKQLLEDGHLTCEVEGSLMLFPLQNIKYIQSSPAPDVLPPNIIRGASFVV